MSKNDDDEAADESSARPLWPSPGRKLQELRESAGLSQENVAESLYLTLHYIRALEKDEYQKLPGLTFVKGYIRAYAKLLKADVDAVLRCYEQYMEGQELEQKQQKLQEPVRVVVSDDNQTEKVVWILVLIVAVLAVAGAVWWFTQ